MPHRDIHIGHLLHYYFKNKQLDGLYLSTAIKAFAGSFITIFVPIYLLTLGFTLREVALFFLISFLIAFLFFSIGLKLNSKIGVKKVMTLGIILSIIYYLLLNSLSNGNINYLLVAFVFGISTGIYWAGFHLEFSRFCDKGKEASENSFLSIFSNISGALGPVIGAVVILETSFNILFIISSIFLLISIIPLFFTKNEKTKFKFSLKNLLKANKFEKAVAYETTGFLGIVGGVFWPIFIFITLEKILSLGIIVSITTIFGAFFLFFVGKLSDKHEKKVLKTGIISHSFSWVTRIFFISPIGIFLNNVYTNFSASLIGLPFSKIIYSKSKKSKDVSNYFLFGELHLLIGRTIVLLFVILTSSILWTFIASFGITFLYFTLLKKR